MAYLRYIGVVKLSNIIISSKCAHVVQVNDNIHLGTVFLLNAKKTPRGSLKRSGFFTNKWALILELSSFKLPKLDWPVRVNLIEYCWIGWNHISYPLLPNNSTSFPEVKEEEEEEE